MNLSNRQIISYYIGLLSITLRLSLTNSQNESNTENDVKVQDITSSNHTGLGDLLQFNISHLGNTVTLHLKKSDNSFLNAPILTFQNGEIVQQHIPQEENIALYQDTVTGASFQARCATWSFNSTCTPLLEGTFYMEGKEYILQPKNKHSNRPKRSLIGEIVTEYTIKEEIEAEPTTYDYKLPPGRQSENEQKINQDILKSTKHIYKRATDRNDIVVEIIVAIDYSIYKIWYADSNAIRPSDKDNEAKNKVREYFAHIINGIDLRYKSIADPNFSISVHPIGYYIADSSKGSPWTENRKEPGEPRDQVHTDPVIEDFQVWTKVTPMMPKFDHAMLFTGLDLYGKSVGGKRSTSTAGLAYVKTICSPDSVSLVEEHGAFKSIKTAAHELGHSLGAYHDGQGNICSENDQYIMSGNSQKKTDQTKRNPWKFSPCSVEYFKDFTLTLGRTSCLTQASSSNIDTSIRSIMLVPPGQKYSADEQCRQLFGLESYVCRGSEFGLVVDICTDMYCADPEKPSYCIRVEAARGTSCGSKKWCIGGECDYDDQAPIFNDECVLGDQPGIIHRNKTCYELLDKQPYYCYQETIRSRCCTTCKKHEKNIPDCAYGNRQLNCPMWYCSLGQSRLLNACCGTCAENGTTKHPLIKSTDFQTKFTPTTRRTTTTRKSTTTTTLKPTTTTPKPTTTTAPKPTTTTPKPTTTTRKPTTTTRKPTTKRRTKITTRKSTTKSRRPTTRRRRPSQRTTTERPTTTTKPNTNEPRKSTSRRPGLTCDATSRPRSSRGCGGYLRRCGEHQCYRNIISQLCWRQCLNNYDSSKTGCEYGNRNPFFCSRLVRPSLYVCLQEAYTCCQTCGDYVDNNNTGMDSNFLFSLSRLMGFWG